MRFTSISHKQTSDSIGSEDTFRPKILILDDDPIVTVVFREHLLSAFPDVEVTVSNEPRVEPGFDIYFIDNDFNGELLATKLLNELREISPHALVVALSSTLDLDVLRTLVNGGCNAVYDKRSLENSHEARTVIKNYIAILKEKHLRGRKSRFVDLTDSLKTLLSQWNQRLNRDMPTGTSKNN